MKFSVAVRTTLLVACFISLQGAESRSAKKVDTDLLKRLLKTVETDQKPPKPPTKVHQEIKKKMKIETRGSSVSYDIYVYTGDKWGAGTDADVYIVLYGDGGQTGEIELDNPGDDFESGDTDVYTVQASVGDLTKIKIGHDDSGWGSGWFLDKVVIESSALGKKWEFLCGRWLDEDEDDGALERELFPTDTSDNGDPTCGIPTITPKSGNARIVGGEEAIPHSWPWQVSLRKPSYWHFCGGTIISKRWVVTAAHCVPDGSASGITVMVGDHDQETSDGETRLDVKRIIVHEAYDANTMQNDIALMELDEDVPWGNYVAPACLPSTQVSVDQECVVTGWGETEDTGDKTKLQQVKVPVMSNSECQTSYGSYITNVNVCAGLEQGGKDSCQGDSGGPMVCRPTGVYVLHGVVSWGYGCADSGYPGVYARVTEFVSWIQDNTGYAGQIH